MANKSLIQGQYFIYTLRILDLFFDKLKGNKPKGNKPFDLENEIKDNIETGSLDDAKIRELFNFSEEKLKNRDDLFSDNRLSDGDFKENKHHGNVGKYMRTYIINEEELNKEYRDAIRHVIEDNQYEYEIDDDCDVHDEINNLNEINKENGEKYRTYVDKILHKPVKLTQKNKIKIPVEEGINWLSLREMPPFYYLFFRWHKINENDLDLVTGAGFKNKTKLKGIISSLSAKRINVDWPIDEIDKYFTYYLEFISNPAVVDSLGYSYTDCTDNIDERKEAIVSGTKFPAANNEVIGLSLLKDLCYVLYHYASFKKPKGQFSGLDWKHELSEDRILYFYPQKTKDNPDNIMIQPIPDWFTAFHTTFDEIINRDGLREIIETAVNKIIKKDSNTKSEKIKSVLIGQNSNRSNMSSKQIDNVLNQIFENFSFRKEIENQVEDLINNNILITNLGEEFTIKKIRHATQKVVAEYLNYISSIRLPLITDEELKDKITTILSEFPYKEIKNTVEKLANLNQFLSLIEKQRDKYPEDQYECMKTNLEHTTRITREDNRNSGNIKFYKDAKYTNLQALGLKIPYIPIIDSTDQSMYTYNDFKFIPDKFVINVNDGETDPDKIYAYTEPDIGILNTQNSMQKAEEKPTRIQELVAEAKRKTYEVRKVKPISELKMYIYDSTFQPEKQKYLMKVGRIPYFTAVARRNFFMGYIAPSPDNIKKILIALIEKNLLSEFLPNNEKAVEVTTLCSNMNSENIQEYINAHINQSDINYLINSTKDEIDNLYRKHILYNTEKRVDGSIEIHNTGTTFCGCGTFILTNDRGTDGKRQPWLMLEKRKNVSEEEGNLCYPSAGSCDFYDSSDYRGNFEKHGMAGEARWRLEANPFKTAARELHEELMVIANPEDLQFICFGIDVNRNLQQFSLLLESQDTAAEILEYSKFAMDADEGIAFIVPFKKDIIFGLLKRYQLEPAAVYALTRLVEIKKDLLWTD